MTNEPVSNKRVAVVGAGLAGLAAAYELSKDPEVSVEVFEKNAYVGGRVCTLPVRELPVDFGGFIVYPWYEQFHRLIAELGIDDQLSSIALKDIFYDVDGDQRYRTQREIDFPASDTWRLYSRIALGVLSQDDMAEPDVHRFQDRTISEHFRHILGIQHETLYERYTDIVCQGYCYAPVDAYKMAFVAPIIRFQRLYGDISTAFYFPDGTGVFARALAQAIEETGGVVHLNSPVTQIQEKMVITPGGKSEFDQIILALPANDPLYQQVLPQVPAGCAYTQFYTVTVEADAIPNVNKSRDWGAVFYRPERHVPYQILSSINLSALYNQPALDGCINFNVVVRDQLVKESALSSQELFERIHPSLRVLFPDVQWNQVLQLRHWTQTMPVAQEAFVESVRHAQGQNDVFFAGDFLGSPSMETALLTGVRAARRVMGEEEAGGLKRIQQRAQNLQSTLRRKTTRQTQDS